MIAFEARQPDASGGFKIAWGYPDPGSSSCGYFEKILRSDGWLGDIEFVPLSKELKKAHGWDSDSDPQGPWQVTEGWVQNL